MKLIISVMIAFITLAVNAQSSLVPGNNCFEKKWLKNETYKMTWFTLKDTVKSELAEVSTSVSLDENYITIVTLVNMKNSNFPWIDTTVANLLTLQPIRHASYNRQRDMVLNFGKTVTGFYYDKQKQQNYLINDTTSKKYFDSNIYPVLITWLPLKEGYTEDISIYDYNPSGKTGVIKAFIINVSSGTYESAKSGTKDVWAVTVADEIGNGKNDFMIYYIDKTDRKLWKQELNVAGRKMLLQRKEI